MQSKKEIFLKVNKDDQIKCLTNEILAKNMQIANYIDKLIALKAKLKETETPIKSKQQKEIVIIYQIKDLKLRLTQLTDNNSRADKRIFQELTNSEQKIITLSEELNKVKSEYDTLMTQNLENVNKIEEYEKNSKILEEKNSEIIVEIDKYKEECNNLKIINEELRLEKDKNDQIVFELEVKLKEKSSDYSNSDQMKIQLDGIINQSKVIEEKLLLYREYKKKYIQLSKAILSFTDHARISINHKQKDLKKEITFKKKELELYAQEKVDQLTKMSLDALNKINEKKNELKERKARKESKAKNSDDKEIKNEKDSNNSIFIKKKIMKEFLQLKQIKEMMIQKINPIKEKILKRKISRKPKKMMSNRHLLL